MSEPVLEIEYDVSRTQLLRLVRGETPEWPKSWYRRIAAIACTACTLFLAVDGYWILAFVVAIVAVQYWSDLPFLILKYVLAQLFAKGYRMHLTVDEKGIRARPVGTESSTRYWWRGLRTVRENEGGIELGFDSSPGGIFIPVGAVADADLYEQFRCRVLDHMRPADLVAAGR